MTAQDTTVSEPTPLSRLGHPVLVADRIAQRVHRMQDLFDVFLSAFGIALVLLLGAYAQSTTSAVTEDVRSVFSGVFRQIVLLPVALVESVFVLVAPLLVIGLLARRRRLRQILESIGAGVVTALLMTALITASPYLPDAITGALTITATESFFALDVLMGVLAAFLTVSGEASQTRIIRYPGFRIRTFIHLRPSRNPDTSVRPRVTTIHDIGSLTRYAFGFNDNRGGAVDLVHGLLHIGIVPKIIRVDLDTIADPLETTAVIEDSRPRQVRGPPRICPN